MNPSNAWACLRTLDSFGIQYVDVIADPKQYTEQNMPGKPNVFNPRYKKMSTAMGSQKWLDLKQHNSTTECILDLKRNGWTIIATDLSPQAVPISSINFDAIGPFAIVLGNEATGIHYL